MRLEERRSISERLEIENRDIGAHAFANHPSILETHDPSRERR